MIVTVLSSVTQLIHDWKQSGAYSVTSGKPRNPGQLGKLVSDENGVQPTNQPTDRPTDQSTNQPNKQTNKQTTKQQPKQQKNRQTTKQPTKHLTLDTNTYKITKTNVVSS